MLCEYEIKLLRDLNGEPQELSWGAAMSVAIEGLAHMGYLTGPPSYQITQKGKDFIKELNKRIDVV